MKMHTHQRECAFYYSSKSLERTTGIEPAFPAWEAGVLPLNHIRTEEIQLFYYTRFPSVCKAQNKNFPDFFQKACPKHLFRAGFFDYRSALSCARVSEKSAMVS